MATYLIGFCEAARIFCICFAIFLSFLSFMFFLKSLSDNECNGEHEIYLQASRFYFSAFVFALLAVVIPNTETLKIVLFR